MTEGVRGGKEKRISNKENSRHEERREGRASKEEREEGNGGGE